MGFWDFFRGKDREKEEGRFEKISIEELKSWISNKKKQIEEQRENFLKIIQERISLLIQEFEEEVSVLKNIDVKERKVEEKIKLIVKENLLNYIAYLEKLISELKEIDKEGDITEKINSLFYNFKKRSSMSFEKATFLIGKELERVIGSINSFFKDLKNTFEENKDLTDQSKIISLIEAEMEKFYRFKKTGLEIEGNINEYSEKIGNLDNNIKIKEEEIEKIRKSEKFLEESKKKQEIETKKQEIEKDINKLREMLDFKALTNFYHIFEKEMTIIKEYKENFKQAFQKTRGEDILSLLREAKLLSPEKLNKIQNITEKEREISRIVIEENGTKDLETEIRKMKSEVDTLNSKKLEEEKKYKNLDRSLKETIDSIRKEVSKMNVEIK